MAIGPPRAEGQADGRWAAPLKGNRGGGVGWGPSSERPLTKLLRPSSTPPLASSGHMLPTRSDNEDAKMNPATLAATLLIATSAVASAHDYRYNDTNNIDGRRAFEMRRIENGRRSGQLTWREYRFLRYEQARIAADER